VIGDVMLDEYVSGDARRVCPEAPVPVIEAMRRWCVPGGAANAAANIAALGGRPLLGGVTGDDYTAGELTKATQAAGIDSSGFVKDASRPTTAKLRVLARGQQVTRVDTESRIPVPAVPSTQLIKWAERMVAETDAVLLSDYGKGVIDGILADRIITAARKTGRPVVVDPKGTNPGHYRGATIVKPNLSELADLSDSLVRTCKEIMEAGHKIAQDLLGTAVLVTRGEEGMALFRSGHPALNLPASPARRVYDVTGAGDTAAAALALGLAAGFSIELATRLANAAGGLAVCKVGTAVVSPDELLAALMEAAPDFVPFST
jgi:D-beta-D-heptose 7-phosphate kinase/D-beta-D-heptose 1-phosphate adenosyltransferase